MSGLLYRLCEYCGDLVPFCMEIAGEKQYYEHYCKKKNRVVKWIEEDLRKKQSQK